MFRLVLILFICFFFTITSYIKDCDENCFFYDIDINRESIKRWPTTCGKVCGNITISSYNTDLTEKELTPVFKNLTKLVGNLKIEYTNFKSLGFLNSNLNFWFDYFNRTGTIVIRANPLLTNVSSLGSWSTYTPYIWHIIDNPKLNFEFYCIKRYGDNVDFNVYGNLKDCGCKVVRIGPKSLPYYPNCTRINGGMDNGLKITLVNESMDLSGLLKLKTLIGNIEVYETSLQNISFLENLSLIEFNYTFHWLDIHDNPKLTRLGLGSLKTLLSSYDSRINEPNMRKRMRLVNNHPDFCITTNELQLLAKHNVEFCFGFEAKLCQDLYRKDGEKVCYFGNLSEMDAGCQHIIGDVLISSENENYARQLENVTHIYGSLAIEGSKELTDTSFLVNLQQVAAMKLEDDKPLIRFNDNKKLQRVFLQNMRARPWPYGYDGIIEIKGNDLEIFKSQRECLLFQKLTQTSIKYNRLSCDKLPTADATTNPTNEVTSDSIGGQDDEEENEGIFHLGSTSEPEPVTTTKLANNFRNFKIIVLFILVLYFPNENCKFTDRYITPESIKNWPVTCKKVCGNIFINANTSLTEKQLKEKFKKLTDLVGNIEIQYTDYQSLGFLGQKLNIYAGMNGVAIRLNANLINATAIGSWIAKTWTRWHIYYNPKLDMTPFCDRALHTPNMDFNVYGNLKNCGCKSVRIGPSSLKSYSNCTSIDGGVQNGLLITQVNDSMDLSGLLKLESITGRLEIYQTNLTSLSFLDNLEIINMTLSEEMNIIDIWSNSKLTKMGFGSLKKLLPGSQKLRISFAFNNPALCITTNELQLLAEHNVELYMDPTLNLCPDLNRKDGEKVCKFDDLESLESDCQHVMGDVLVDSNNEKFAPNLENVTNIYGSLMVKGTTELTSLNFLENLQQVANFTVDRNNPLVQISSNEKLQSVSFPSMTFPLYLYSKDFQVIKINDNALDIFKDPDQCKKLEKSTKTEIEYNDKGCDFIVSGGEEEDKTGDDSNIKSQDDPNTEPSKKSSGGCWNLRTTVLLLLYLF